MSAKRLVLVLCITLLVLLNLWHWWPEEQGGMVERAPVGQVIALEQLLLRAKPDADIQPLRRDPFSSAGLGLDTAGPKAPPVVEDVSALESVEMPASFATPPADTLVGQLTLAGVVFRNGVGYGFVMEQGFGHLVSKGSMLFGRYQVEEVTLRSLTLRDVSEGTQMQLALQEAVGSRE